VPPNFITIRATSTGSLIETIRAKGHLPIAGSAL
jgi:hypothetical protein